MNLDKLLKFMDSMVVHPCPRLLMIQMNAIRNMEMRMFGNIAVRFSIF